MDLRHAACRQPGVDPEWFFSEDMSHLAPEGDARDWTLEDYRVVGQLNAKSRERELRAQIVCMGCPLIAECARLGMDEDHGVWGGVTPGERIKLRKGTLVRGVDSGPVDSPTRDAVVGMFADGLTVEQVADVLATKRLTVLRHLNQYIARSQDVHADLGIAS